MVQKLLYVLSISEGEIRSRTDCCNIVLQFTNIQSCKVRHTQLWCTAHTVVRYGTHSCEVWHTPDVKYDTHSCHVRIYVNDRSQAITIRGTDVSRTRLRSYVTNNACDVLYKTPLFLQRLYDFSRATLYDFSRATLKSLLEYNLVRQQLI